MKRLSATSLVLAFAASLFAHPMGNFSVNHYTKLVVTVPGVEVEYALDLAEIPTLELLRSWGLDRSSPPKELDKKARMQASDWLNGLTVIVNGTAKTLKFENARLVIANGAGDLPILRITTRAHIDAEGGILQYEDRNFPERAGWKEIVIDAGRGAILKKASQSTKDTSRGLTSYPSDPTDAPPQDLRAQVEWTAGGALAGVGTHRRAEDGSRVAAKTVRPVIAPVQQPQPAMRATPPALMTQKAAPAGTVVRGDFLSRLLQRRELSVWMIIIALAAAFALGAAHALTPGHGKTIVAAYLVGSRGNLKHAAFLGAMVTFTHTIAVFALGLAALFLFRYIVPEKLTEILGVISGLSIVAVGAWMLAKRIRRARDSRPHASHTHNHGHRHTHTHHHDHSHHHDGATGHGHTHSHVPDEISWGGLIALGASGGLVPCESALILLLGAIAVGRVGLGLLLLISFSLGLALVLMIIGALVLYVKNLIPEKRRARHSAVFQWISVLSPAIVMVVGLLMTSVSLGWIEAKWAGG